MSATTPTDFIPLCVPEIGGNEWAYVKECLDTTMVSSVGSYVNRFETAVAQKAGAQYGVATVNGTSALHVALQLAGVGPGDEVLTSDLTFIAPANAVRYLGATPVFFDAEPEHWQMDVEKVAAFLDNQCATRQGVVRNKDNGKRIAAILPVHILGHTVDMTPLLDTAHRHHLPVVADAAEALGATYSQRDIGTLGDLVCVSFNGNKIVTAGGAGMVLTDRSDWAERAKYLTTQAKDDGVEYIHGDVGFNYRLTNLNAALGVAQMEQLDAFVEKKRAIARRYDEGLGEVPGVTTMSEADEVRSTFWMYTVLIDAQRFGMNRRTLHAHLAELGIQTRPLWQPMHLSKPHRDCPSPPCPCAEEIYERALSLPCSVGLTEAVQQRVIDVVRDAHRKCPT